jgi:DNA-binding PadR family transcriptional regulator
MAISTLGYALLGLLAREPLSGLDLARVLERQVAYFWNARHSQIYPELARLEAAGLVTHEVVEQRDRPSKKVYTLSERGLAALRAWVATPSEPHAVRDELVLKVASIWLLEPARAVALLLDHAHRREERLARYEGFERDLRERFGAELDDPRSPRFATYLTLRRGMSYEREYAAWCRAAAEQLGREAERLATTRDADQIDRPE